jgi:hypothetical protein
VSASRSDLVGALECAARGEDAALFDATLDRLLESARDEADPEIHLQELVAQRLRGTLSGVPSCARNAASPARGSRVVPVAVAAPRSAGFARGLGVLAVGVAIGFGWGRSPRWWPGDRGAAPQAAVPATSAPSALARPPAAANGQAIETRLSGLIRARQSSGSDREPSQLNSLPSKPDALRSKPNPLHSKPDPLRFTLEQLRKAQLLLRAGEPKRALDLLDLLDARVPSSILEEERDVTRTLALCDAGDATAAAVRAQRLLERAPGSVYALSLRESCAGKAVLLDEMRRRTSNPPH